MRKEDMYFVNRDLTGANFAGRDLTGAEFVRCDLTDVLFIGAKLNGARFMSCWFSGTDFSGASTVGAVVGLAEGDVCEPDFVDYVRGVIGVDTLTRHALLVDDADDWGDEIIRIPVFGTTEEAEAQAAAIVKAAPWLYSGEEE